MDAERRHFLYTSGGFILLQDCKVSYKWRFHAHKELFTASRAWYKSRGSWSLQSQAVKEKGGGLGGQESRIASIEESPRDVHVP
jgi:hypothetical protein